MANMEQTSNVVPLKPQHSRVEPQNNKRKESASLPAAEMEFRQLSSQLSPMGDGNVNTDYERFHRSIVEK